MTARPVGLIFRSHGGRERRAHALTKTRPRSERGRDSVFIHAIHRGLCPADRSDDARRMKSNWAIVARGLIGCIRSRRSLTFSAADAHCSLGTWTPKENKS